MHNHIDALDQLHILLALVIMAAYLTVPFTALRQIPIPRAATISGTFFFLTCAITHLAVAAGFHTSNWMLINDTVQAVSVITFIASMNRMVVAVLRRRRRPATAAPRE